MLKNSVPADWMMAAHHAAPPPPEECRSGQASELHQHATEGEQDRAEKKVMASAETPTSST